VRILLDTHLVIDLLRGLRSRHPGLPEAVDSLHVSVASLWEIAIKARLGKLDPGVPLDALPVALERSGVQILPVVTEHALARLDRAPPTKDPFDRLLLVICQVEGLRLATIDRALVEHPLALDTSRQFP
jgi:PIN domain nuclease of toxin-antitoxin system